MEKIKLMLPAYNEAQSLPSLLKRISIVKEQFQLPLDILVVNDGSQDDTAAIARSHGVAVLDLQPNRGLAGAMRAGFQEALKDMTPDDILITMDADDSHHPGLIYRMLIQIREGSDLVIASRYRPGARIVGLSRFRKYLSSGAGILFKIFRPIEGVRDYTCGYRAYRVRLLQQMMQYYGDQFITQEGFGCMAEILLKSRVFQPVVHELPFILRYDQKMGASKMRVLRTVKDTLQLIFSQK